MNPFVKDSEQGSCGKADLFIIMSDSKNVGAVVLVLPTDLHPMMPSRY